MYGVTAIDAAGNESARFQLHRRPGIDPVNSHLIKVEGAGNDFLLGTGAWAATTRR